MLQYTLGQMVQKIDDTLEKYPDDKVDSLEKNLEVKNHVSSACYSLGTQGRQVHVGYEQFACKDCSKIVIEMLYIVHHVKILQTKIIEMLYTPLSTM